MINIKNLAMAEAVFANKDISTEKTFLGLNLKVIYKPTGSRVGAYELYYNYRDLGTLNQLFDKEPSALEKDLLKKKLETTKMSDNIRLEICLSWDKKFAGLQLLQYSDFFYKPISKPRFFENGDAEIIAGLLPLK